MELLFSPQALVYAAGACYILGFLITHQVTLRLMVLLGTGFYIVYYFIIAGDPLWEAIYISLMIAVANVIGLMSLFARGSKFAIPRAHKDIYGHFPSLTPGDFRMLMKRATRKTAHEPTPLTVQNAPLTKLFYVISGATEVSKSGDNFRVPAGTFVGEVAYLKGQRASACTTLMEGSEYLEWDTADLYAASARSSRFKLALEAVLSLDLAQKVSVSVAPQGPQWRPQRHASE